METGTSLAPTTLAQRIGRRARRVRESRKLGIRDVAKKAGLGIGALSEIENGKREGRLDSYERLAKALGVPLGWLLGFQSHQRRVARPAA